MVSESAAVNAGIAKGFNRNGKVGAWVGFAFGWQVPSTVLKQGGA